MRLMTGRWTWLPGLPIVMGLLVLSGCAQVLKTPTTLRNVTAADLGEQHPFCLQSKGHSAPKAFIIKNETNWKAFWGAGEEPPVVNFEQSMVFVAQTSLSSDGPGTMEIWVQKHRETEQVVETRVLESVGGSWPLSTAYSRAYHIVTLPTSTKPVKVTWRYLWGTRDETRELQAKEWTPTRSQGGQGGWPNQSSQGGWPSRSNQGGRPSQNNQGGWPSRSNQGGWPSQSRQPSR